MEVFALILFLAVLLYGALVIMEEKKAFRENARSCKLGPFSFAVPSWWKQTPVDDGKVIFTSSDWQGTFHLLPPEGSELKDELTQKVHAQQIVFDEDATIHHPPFKKNSLRGSRIEGTATENEETRIYFDAFLMECLRTQRRLYGQSKSPVLSGPREGPWFEECFNNCCSVPLVEKPEEKSSEFS